MFAVSVAMIATLYSKVVSLEVPSTPVHFTPNHILPTMSPDTLPVPLFQEVDVHLRRWREGQHLADHIWEMWRRGCLTSLQFGGRWRRQQPNLVISDVAVLQAENHTELRCCDCYGDMWSVSRCMAYLPCSLAGSYHPDGQCVCTYLWYDSQLQVRQKECFWTLRTGTLVWSKSICDHIEKEHGPLLDMDGNQESEDHVAHLDYQGEMDLLFFCDVCLLSFDFT